MIRNSTSIQALLLGAWASTGLAQVTGIDCPPGCVELNASHTADVSVMFLGPGGGVFDPLQTTLTPSATANFAHGQILLRDAFGVDPVAPGNPGTPGVPVDETSALTWIDTDYVTGPFDLISNASISGLFTTYSAGAFVGLGGGVPVIQIDPLLSFWNAFSGTDGSTLPGGGGSSTPADCQNLVGSSLYSIQRSAGGGMTVTVAGVDPTIKVRAVIDLNIERPDACQDCMLRDTGLEPISNPEPIRTESRVCDRWYTFVRDRVESPLNSADPKQGRVVGVSHGPDGIPSVRWYDSDGLLPLTTACTPSNFSLPATTTCYDVELTSGAPSPNPGDWGERRRIAFESLYSATGEISIIADRTTFPLSAIEDRFGTGGCVPGELDMQDLADIFPMGRPSTPPVAGEVTPLLSEDEFYLDVNRDGTIDAFDYDFFFAVCQTADTANACRVTGCFDIDGNGTVDLPDLLVVLSERGSSGPGLDGDVDGDFDVDLNDQLAVLAEFGNSCP